jgi:hypothetical protein
MKKIFYLLLVIIFISSLRLSTVEAIPPPPTTIKPTGRILLQPTAVDTNGYINPGANAKINPNPTATTIPTQNHVVIGVVGSVFPTSTPKPQTANTNTVVSNCLCNTDGTCAAVCTFDKFAAPVTYIDPIKCSLSDSFFATIPSTANKTSWCQITKRTKGDADGSGIVNNTDYFYYVAAVNGGKIPATVNPDFNGDGEVGASDRVIIVASLNL